MLVGTYSCGHHKISPYFKRLSKLKMSCKNPYWVIYLITQVGYSVSGECSSSDLGQARVYMTHTHTHMHTHAHIHTCKHAAFWKDNSFSSSSLWTHCLNSPHMWNNTSLQCWQYKNDCNNFSETLALHATSTATGSQIGNCAVFSSSVTNTLMWAL